MMRIKELLRSLSVTAEVTALRLEVAYLNLALATLGCSMPWEKHQALRESLIDRARCQIELEGKLTRWLP